MPPAAALECERTGWTLDMIATVAPASAAARAARWPARPAPMIRTSCSGIGPRSYKAASLAELTHDVEDRVHVGLRRPPVHDGRAEGHAPRVDGRPHVDAAVLEHRGAQAAVVLVELLLGHPGWPVAEADDVQTHRREQLQILGLLDPAGQPLGEVEVALHHRPVPGAAVGAQRGPDRQGAGT